LESWSQIWVCDFMANGTISLPTHNRLDNVPSSSVLVIRAAMASGPVSGGVAFSKLSKLLNQENALSAPCLQHLRNYCGAIKAARDVTLSFATSKSSRRQMLIRFRRLAADARARSAGARPSKAVVARRP
jgi:hypothetical protein